MDEDRLSPAMGRLIDAAKMAASQAAPFSSRAEGVALLTANGAVHSGHGGSPAPVFRCAVDSALASLRRAGGGMVIAAAVAGASESVESMFPCADCSRSLAELDPGMTVVVKKLGRWVALRASELARPA